MLNLIDQRVNGLRNEIARESKSRYENIEHLESCLEVIKFFIKYILLGRFPKTLRRNQKWNQWERRAWQCFDQEDKRRKRQNGWNDPRWEKDQRGDWRVNSWTLKRHGQQNQDRAWEWKEGKRVKWGDTPFTPWRNLYQT